MSICAPPSTLVRGRASIGRLWAGDDRLVVCFPAAGSSVLSFRPLAHALTGPTVLAVEPLERAAAPPGNALVHLAGRLADDLRPWLTDDVTLVGHSFGGYLAYEVAHRLRAAGAHAHGRLRLVVVGCTPPTHPGGSPDTGDDDALVGSLIALGAIPEVLRREPVLLRQYLPTIRADLASATAYLDRFRAPGQLKVPTLAVRGTADPLVATTALAGWRQLCHPTELRCLPGDHYLPQNAPGVLADELVAWAGSRLARSPWA